MPPLSALRAFEAAGRLGGFALAAQELGVTPGAVTAHVKGLEEALGAPLFERGARGVRLTSLGATVLPRFTAAFDSLSGAVRQLQSEAAPQVVRIATLPALAQLWLSPRLPGLRAVDPSIRVSITAMEAPPDAKRDPHDLYLFYRDRPDRPHARDLGRDRVFPVCAPSVAARLNTPKDLMPDECLSDTTWAEDWVNWTEAAGLRGFQPRGPAYSLYALAVEEAVNGAGVLIGHAALVERHLTEGRLVQPFAKELMLSRSLVLWPARRPAPGSAVAKVIDWLTGEDPHEG